MTEESEFGMGFAYCLGLFLCHDERRPKYMEREHYKDDASMWFYGAVDHLLDLQIPDFPQKKLAQELLDKCMEWLGDLIPTWEDAAWSVQTAKDLLRYWDEFNGIKTIKGGWE